MTTTNINTLESAVSKFKALKPDDKLVTLALLYDEISDEIAPVSTQNTEQTGDAANLVKQIQQLSSEQQIVALRDLLSTDSKSQGETALDGNPSKALGELFTGNGQESDAGNSNNQYIAMNADSRLSFWFQLAQNLGKAIVGIPADYIPSDAVNEVLDLVGDAKIDDLVTFFKQAL